MPTDPWGRAIVREDVWAEIVTITPARAHQLIAINTHNRTLTDSKVEQFAGVLVRGEAVLNGETIKIGFNQDGEMILMDGQHRMHAVAKTNISYESGVFWNLPYEALATIDEGKKRTFGDDLTLQHEANSSRLAGALGLLYAYIEAGTMDIRQVNPVATRIQKARVFEEHQELREFAHPPYAATANKLLSPSLSTCLYYLFSLTDSDDAMLFFDILGTGSSADRGDPAYMLRERLIKESQKNRERMSVTTRAAYAIKAFNLWREGEKVQLLRWSNGGSNPEAFPRIKDCPIIPKPYRQKARR